MSETVKRYNTHLLECLRDLPESVVDATDYARLEQECKDAKCQAELMQRAAEVFREDKAAAVKQVEGLRVALQKIESETAATWVCDVASEALSAKP